MPVDESPFPPLVVKLSGPQWLIDANRLVKGQKSLLAETDVSQSGTVPPRSLRELHRRPPSADLDNGDDQKWTDVAAAGSTFHYGRVLTVFLFLGGYGIIHEAHIKGVVIRKKAITEIRWELVRLPDPQFDIPEQVPFPETRAFRRNTI
jgi:hypothetical protein